MSATAAFSIMAAPSDTVPAASMVAPATARPMAVLIATAGRPTAASMARYGYGAYHTTAGYAGGGYRYGYHYGY